jgi:hypothetical protein
MQHFLTRSVEQNSSKRFLCDSHTRLVFMAVLLHAHYEHNFVFVSFTIHLIDKI